MANECFQVFGLNFYGYLKDFRGKASESTGSGRAINILRFAEGGGVRKRSPEWQINIFRFFD